MLEIDTISAPYSFEKDFYKENNIPIWECKIHETVSLGKIYQGDDGQYIIAEVNCWPAQFWKFEILSKESGQIIKIETGSGGLQNYFETMKSIADGMIVINSVEKTEK